MAEELLNPARAKSVPPRHHTTASPAKQSPTPQRLYTASVWLADGHQLQHEGAIQVNMSSPAPVDWNKCAKTPTREPDEPVRCSRSLHRHCGEGMPKARAAPNRKKSSSQWDMSPLIARSAKRKRSNTRRKRGSTRVRHLSGTWRGRRLKSKRCSHTVCSYIS